MCAAVGGVGGFGYFVADSGGGCGFFALISGGGCESSVLLAPGTPGAVGSCIADDVDKLKLYVWLFEQYTMIDFLESREGKQ